MADSSAFETTLDLIKQLSIVEKVRLIEYIAPAIEQDLTSSPPAQRKSLRGMWHDTHTNSVVGY